MNELLIENIENGHRFVLMQKRAGIFVKTILFGLTILTTAIPFFVLFSSTEESSVIVGAIISGFCALFLFRLLMWNVYGKEVFEFQQGHLFHYIDYKFFKDKLYEGAEEIAFEIQEEQVPSKEAEKKYRLYVFSAKKECSKSNIKLNQAQINKMLALLKA